MTSALLVRHKNTIPNQERPWPANGKLTINGGTFTDDTAVYVKSGSLEINGGTFKGTGEQAAYEYTLSVFEATGDAVVIENVGADEYDAVASVAINGGTFNSTNAKAVASYTAGKEGVAAKTGFIANGTFSSDVSELCVEGYKAEQNIATGLYEIVEAPVMVAVIGTTEYKTVAAALAVARAGETVKLIADTEEAYVLVTPGVTLDLNKHVLKANYVTTFGGANIIDSYSNGKGQAGGVLKVARDSLVLNPSNEQLPIWNGTDGFVFSHLWFMDNNAKNGTGLTLDTDTDTAKLRFYTLFDYVDEELVFSNASAKGVNVIVRLSWTVLNADGSVNGVAKQDFVYSDEQVATVAKAAGKAVFTLNLNQYSTLKDLTITTMVTSEQGVAIAGTTFNVE